MRKDGDMIMASPSKEEWLTQGYEVIICELVEDPIVMPLRSCGRAQSGETSTARISDPACAMIRKILWVERPRLFLV